jgi:hypothetical protein
VPDNFPLWQMKNLIYCGSLLGFSGDIADGMHPQGYYAWWFGAA